jgi:response regulator RpfG family c-di-GMP phosphodiesterase
MAVMLVDVLLEAHEIEVAKNREGIPKDKLDPKIVNHPLETSRILNKRGTTLPRETVIIIEQHHERPDGKGYPMGMNHTNINILAACYIVSCHFIDLLVVNQFKPEKKDEILTELFDEYAMGNYKKAVRALQKILG